MLLIIEKKRGNFLRIMSGNKVNVLDRILLETQSINMSQIIKKVRRLVFK
jgi:hypothetical protein